tara:strand:- start:1892 stop:2071 length:180 start_codon:yes stop_codon:yes gene_type:complete
VGKVTKTTVASVGKTSNSVRTVIPMWIAELMDLEKGTKLKWKLVRSEDGYIAQIEGETK